MAGTFKGFCSKITIYISQLSLLMVNISVYPTFTEFLQKLLNAKGGIHKDFGNL
jgi:hypothetical protein